MRKRINAFHSTSRCSSAAVKGFDFLPILAVTIDSAGPSLTALCDDEVRGVPYRQVDARPNLEGSGKRPGASHRPILREGTGFLDRWQRRSLVEVQMKKNSPRTQHVFMLLNVASNCPLAPPSLL